MRRLKQLPSPITCISVSRVQRLPLVSTSALQRVRRARRLYHTSWVKCRSGAGILVGVIVGVATGGSPGAGVEGDVGIVVGDAVGVAACENVGSGVGGAVGWSKDGDGSDRDHTGAGAGRVRWSLQLVRGVMIWGFNVEDGLGLGMKPPDRDSRVSEDFAVEGRGRLTLEK